MDEAYQRSDVDDHGEDTIARGAAHAPHADAVAAGTRACDLVRAARDRGLPRRVIYPSLAGAVYAFTDWSGIGGAANWVGLDNFKRLFTDDQSFGALRNTVLLTIFIVIVQNASGSRSRSASTPRSRAARRCG